jgi:hypothetical protein
MAALLCERQTREQQHHIENYTVIVDLQDVRLGTIRKCFTRLFQPYLADIDQLHYPERLGVLFVIHAPLMFSAIWAIVRPFLPEETAKKMRLFRGNYRAELQTVIDSKVLPPCYGGTGEHVGAHSHVLEVFEEYGKETQRKDNGGSVTRAKSKSSPGRKSGGTKSAKGIVAGRRYTGESL